VLPKPWQLFKSLGPKASKDGEEREARSYTTKAIAKIKTTKEYRLKGLGYHWIMDYRSIFFFLCIRVGAWFMW
jgi:hypothetical protein